MNHEVEVSNLMFNKTSDEPIEFKKYDINVELEEESSNEQKTVLKYSIDLTSNPKNSVINITGNTILTGESSEIEQYLKQEDQKTPQVVSLIYQELFPLIYIISKNMKIPTPSHSISQGQTMDPLDTEISKKIKNEIQDESEPSEETSEQKPKEEISSSKTENTEKFTSQNIVTEENENKS